MAGARPSAARRNREKSRRVAMPGNLHNVPAGYDWGWYSREEPRMHLKVIDEKHKRLKYKVWLEKEGRRVVEPAGEIPVKILTALRTELARNRDVVEDSWVRFMIRKGWLKAFVE